VASLIDFAVLSLMIERSSYGYRMSDEFDQRFGGFLSLSQSNLYDVLKRLEGEGYIEVAGQSGSRGRPRIHYRSTDAGAAAYRAWLAECLRDDPQRLGLLSRLASTSLGRGEAMLDVIDRYAEECLAEARELETPLPRDATAVAGACSELMEDLISEERRRVVAARLGWIAYARGRIDAAMSSTGGARG
jgi:DNA-binding PadR family transcriptional regulator